MREKIKVRYLRDCNGKVDKRYVILESGTCIMDRKTGRRLKPHLHNGYMVISIKINGVYHNEIKMASLNWMAWKGPILNGNLIHHKDENKVHDHITNLDHLSRAEHVILHKTGKSLSVETREKISNSHFGKRHSIKTKKLMSNQRMGERNFNGKLSQGDVDEIRISCYNAQKKYGSGMRKQIAQKYSVSMGCIDHLLSGFTWNPDKLSPNELRMSYE